MHGRPNHPLNVESGTSGPPCSFTAFVAEHHGVSVREAEQLIEHWLETYEPRTDKPDLESLLRATSFGRFAAASRSRLAEPKRL
jgi:hypothetical protein